LRLLPFTQLDSLILFPLKVSDTGNTVKGCPFTCDPPPPDPSLRPAPFHSQNFGSPPSNSSPLRVFLRVLISIPPPDLPPPNGSFSVESSSIPLLLSAVREPWAKYSGSATISFFHVPTPPPEHFVKMTPTFLLQPGKRLFPSSGSFLNVLPIFFPPSRGLIVCSIKFRDLIGPPEVGQFASSGLYILFLYFSPFLPILVSPSHGRLSSCQRSDSAIGDFTVRSAFPCPPFPSPPTWSVLVHPST